jgi:hypothetical protein
MRTERGAGLSEKSPTAMEAAALVEVEVDARYPKAPNDAPRGCLSVGIGYCGWNKH